MPNSQMLIDIAGKRISKEEFLKSKQKKVVEKPKVLFVRYLYTPQNMYGNLNLRQLEL